MKKIALVAFAAAATLSLAACGRTSEPDAQASADNVELPAEEAVNSAEASASPVKDTAPSSEATTTSDVKAAAAQTAKDFEDLGDEKPAAPAKAN